MNAFATTPRPYLIQNSLQTVLRSLLRSFACISVFASASFAHDGHPSAPDPRITPRAAANHATGTLPRSTGESTTAITQVVSEQFKAI